MTSTIRYPLNREIPNFAQAESSQIITIFSGNNALVLGGEQAYADVRAWHTADERNMASPYSCVSIEFSANGAFTLGDGETELIGIYGQIDLVAAPTLAAQRKRMLLAILGLGLGSQMPQIPIVQQAGPASDFVGYSQMLGSLPAFDRLSIGGVLGPVLIPEGVTLTVVARPLRQREFLG
jgi:hypothetical protein